MSNFCWACLIYLFKPLAALVSVPNMAPTVESQLLDALELFEYAYRFRDRLFVLCFPDGAMLEPLLTDLRVLKASRIHCFLLSQTSQALEKHLKELSKRGFGISLYDRSLLLKKPTDIQATAASAISMGNIPAILLEPEQSLSSAYEQISQAALSLTLALCAKKLFFFTDQDGLIVDGKFVSHCGPHELEKILQDKTATNLEPDHLRRLQSWNINHGLDIVLLRSVPGNLFEEIFTHKGVGTLFTDRYTNTIRRGKLKDVFDVSRLLKPFIESTAILPVTEDEIADEIDDYFLYLVNDSIVAASHLKRYGHAAALSKFCTLPRYQGKGRARDLARKMIDEAKSLKLDYVFALSTEKLMWSFFENLGFQATSRESLPESWKIGYDFSRPSKAFVLSLS